MKKKGIQKLANGMKKGEVINVLWKKRKKKEESSDDKIRR